jgi:hypothetical protein
MAKEVMAEVCGVRLWRFSPPKLGHCYLAIEDPELSSIAVKLRFIDEQEAWRAFDRRVLVKIHSAATLDKRQKELR